MSSTHTQSDPARSATADPTAAQRLNEWRTRLDSFATAFDAEISQILTTLSSLQLDEVKAAPHVLQSDKKPAAPRLSNGDQTMEFILPATPPAVPAPLSSPPPEASPQVSMPATVSEPNRLAALKAKLSQQMASTGHPHAASARTAETNRS
jgi:hypothetical protein